MFCVDCAEFPANEMVKFLVGFTNKGSQDFTVRSLEASFRYPQDYQFYIQNVSLSTLHREMMMIRDFSVENVTLFDDAVMFV